MPNYDYECDACGHVQEEFHSMAEKPKIKCDKCKEKMRKAFRTSEINMGENKGSDPNDY